MLAPRNQIARLQSDFYRDQFRRMLRWLIVSSVIMFALIAGVIYLLLFQAPQRYYANTTEGKILAMPSQA